MSGFDRFSSPAEPSNRRKRKRFLLFVALALEIFGYIVLVEARYEGQGIAPNFFRLTTLSDIFSIGYFFLCVALIVLDIVTPDRISLGRTWVLLLASGILLWLDFGLRHTSPEEFSSEASVILLTGMLLFVAMLLTRREGITIVRTSIRIVSNTILIAIVLMLAAFFYAFFFPTYSGTEEISAFNADAGVILGAAVWRGHGLGERASPALRERIDLGYQLLTAHAIPRLVVTGGSAPGELAEAEVAKLTLIKKGIDPSEIIEESSSHTTLEQVQFLREELFLKQGWNRFVIVSDQYHLARVCDMCKFNGLTVIGSPSHIHEPFFELAYYRLRESAAMIVYWMLGR